MYILVRCTHLTTQTIVSNIQLDSETDSSYASETDDDGSTMSIYSDDSMSDDTDSSDSDTDSDGSDWLLEDMTEEKTNREGDEYVPSSASSSDEPSATVTLPRRPTTRKRKTPSASSSGESVGEPNKRVRRAVGGTLLQCEPLKKITVGTMEEQLGTSTLAPLSMTILIRRATARSITTSLLPPQLANSSYYSRSIQHARNHYTPAKRPTHESNGSA